MSFNLLPIQAEVTAARICKNDLADQYYQTYDIALPQSWVNACMFLGYDPRRNFVWNYDQIFLVGRNIFGVPGPLTEEAAKWIQNNREKINDNVYANYSRTI